MIPLGSFQSELAQKTGNADHMFVQVEEEKSNLAPKQPLDNGEAKHFDTVSHVEEEKFHIKPPSNAYYRVVNPDGLHIQHQTKIRISKSSTEKQELTEKEKRFIKEMNDENKWLDVEHGWLPHNS